jgi:DNA-binding NarL/FixJ family response regulator
MPVIVLWPEATGRRGGTTDSEEVSTTPGGPGPRQTAQRGVIWTPALPKCTATRYYRGAMGVIRVALAEDNVLLREGISRLVAANDEFELVGAASDLPQLLAVVAEQEPDVVVTDIRMPPTGTDEGIQAAAWIRENHPTVGVVVLSQYTAPGYAVALLEHGSAGRGYLLKERVASVDELARAIRTVAQGGSVIDPMVVDELVRARSQERQSGLSSLTPRESEILAEMAQGKSNAAIAATLFVTERAVEKHTNSIFAKLGLSEEKDVNRRVKAVLVFLSQRPGR